MIKLLQELVQQKYKHDDLYPAVKEQAKQLITEQYNSGSNHYTYTDK